MRVICPYTPSHLRQETLAALREIDAYHPVQWEDVSASDFAYADLIDRLWADGEAFLLIEHDMLPTLEAVERMISCPRRWCACPYPVNHQPGESIVGFGFTRFAAELLTAEPDAAEAAGRWSRAGVPARHWSNHDSRLARVLTGRGYDIHRHAWIGHLHLA